MKMRAKPRPRRTKKAGAGELQVSWRKVPLAAGCDSQKLRQRDRKRNWQFLQGVFMKAAIYERPPNSISLAILNWPS
jgi:hypothetical protein